MLCRPIALLGALVTLGLLTSPLLGANPTAKEMKAWKLVEKARRRNLTLDSTMNDWRRGFVKEHWEYLGLPRPFGPLGAEALAAYERLANLTAHGSSPESEKIHWMREFAREYRTEHGKPPPWKPDFASRRMRHRYVELSRACRCEMAGNVSPEDARVLAKATAEDRKWRIDYGNLQDHVFGSEPLVEVPETCSTERIRMRESALADAKLRREVQERRDAEASGHARLRTILASGDLGRNDRSSLIEIALKADDGSLMRLLSMLRPTDVSTFDVNRVCRGADADACQKIQGLFQGRMTASGPSRTGASSAGWSGSSRPEGIVGAVRSSYDRAVQAANEKEALRRQNESLRRSIPSAY